MGQALVGLQKITRGPAGVKDSHERGSHEEQPQRIRVRLSSGPHRVVAPCGVAVQVRTLLEG